MTKITTAATTSKSKSNSQKNTKSTTKRTRTKGKKSVALPLVELRVNCEQFILNDYLDFVVKAIPRNPTYPILNNVLIVADQAQQLLHLSTYNLEFGIQASLAAKVLTGGKITINAGIFQQMVKKFPPGEIRIHSTKPEKNDSTIITTLFSEDNSYFEIMGMSAAEFPNLPTTENKLITISGSLLIAQLKASLFAASNDSNKHILNGSHFIFQADSEGTTNSITTWTTDGHRLVLTKVEEAIKIKEDTLGKLTRFTLPIKVLIELEKNLNFTDVVTIYYDSDTLVFTWPEKRLVTRIIEGEYPDCINLVTPLKEKYNRELIVERVPLQVALSQLAVLSDKSVKAIKMKLDSQEQKIHLSIEHQEVGKGKISLNAQITGKDLTINVDVRYLLDICKAITTFELKLSMVEPHTPILITGCRANGKQMAQVEAEYIVAPLQ